MNIDKFPEWAFHAAWTITRHDDACECEDECLAIALAVYTAYMLGKVDGKTEDRKKMREFLDA